VVVGRVCWDPVSLFVAIRIPKHTAKEAEEWDVPLAILRTASHWHRTNRPISKRVDSSRRLNTRLSKFTPQGLAKGRPAFLFFWNPNVLNHPFWRQVRVRMREVGSEWRCRFGCRDCDLPMHIWSAKEYNLQSSGKCTFPADELMVVVVVVRFGIWLSDG
jgi:hypothetical protein